MNLRRLRHVLLFYVLCDLLAGYAGIIPLTECAAAQFTTATGTVVDPNGIPYAFATITPLLVIPSGAGSPTLSGQSYFPPTQATGLDISGHFTVQLADNTVLLPAATKWNFTVCSAGGTVPPAGGKGPVCFSLAAPITISGSSQDISTQLNAVALALTLNAGGCAIGTCIVNNPNADQTITGSPRPRLIISGNSYNTTLSEDSASPTDAIETHSSTTITCCTLPQGGWTLFGHSNTLGVFPTIAFARSLGTQGTPLAISNTTSMWRLASMGYDGTGYFTGASIITSAQENWTNTTHGTAMVFDYVPNGGIGSVHGLILGAQCISGTSPACVGSSSSYGVVAVPTGATPTLVIQTAQVQTISRIFLEIDESATIPSTTCNTTLAQLVQPVVTARSAGTSFTIQINATVTVNPVCVSWWIVN
jgi:hypothetical protein